MQEQLRVRQPLGELVAVTADPEKQAALRRFEGPLLDELNVKTLQVRPDAGELERFEIVPNMRALGPKHKSEAGKVAQALGALDAAEAARTVQAGGELVVQVDGRDVTVAAEAVEVRRLTPENLAVAEAAGVMLVLSTEITPELRDEGWARDTVRHVQQLRKDADLNIEDRIRLHYATDSTELAAAVEAWRDYVMAETLSVSMEAGSGEGEKKTVRIGDAEITISLARVDA